MTRTPKGERTMVLDVIDLALALARDLRARGVAGIDVEHAIGMLEKDRSPVTLHIFAGALEGIVVSGSPPVIRHQARGAAAAAQLASHLLSLAAVTKPGGLS